MMNDKQMPPQAPSYGFTSAPPAEYPPQYGGYPPPPPHHGGHPPPPGAWHTQQGYPPPPQLGYPPAPPQHGYPPPVQGYPPQAYAPPQPPPYIQPQPEPVMVVPAGGWYSRNQKNKPQSNAAGAAALIFISGGMNIAWSTGFRGLYYFPINQHVRVAWFIGAIIGAVISAFLANKVPKKLVVIFSGVLVTIGGIVIATSNTSREAITAGLYLDGIGNGLVFAPFLALVGEVSVFYMRGLIGATTDQLCFITGYMVQVVYTSSWTNNNYYYYHDEFTAENMKGVLSAIYGFLAIIFGALLCIESPVIELANGDEPKAIDILRRLQRPYQVTNETYDQLAEHKRYLAQNKDLTVGQSIVQALPAYFKLCYLRAMNAMSLSYTLSITAYLWRSSNLVAWFIGFAVCRWFGTFLTTFCMESLGRKKPILVGLIVCSGLAFAIGSQYNPLTRSTDTAIMLLIFQFFAGVAFTGTSPYLTEAYPLGVKQHFIAFTFVVEMLIFIIAIVVQFSIIGGINYLYIAGGLYLFGFVTGIFCLPETKRTTLRQAQDKFRGFK